MKTKLNQKDKLELLSVAYDKIWTLNECRSDIFHTLMSDIGYSNFNLDGEDGICDSIWSVVHNNDRKRSAMSELKKMIK
jgi:hypothetical protein